MNREIKFRAWDTKHKEMLNSRDQGYQGEVFKWLKEGQPLEVMQFTGLHDRTGREVYEGDVVQWDVNSSFSVGVVTFERGCYDLKSLDGERWVCCDWYRGEYEVLGNIHENPELCKD